MPDPVPNRSLRILNVTEINETPRPVLIKEEPQDLPPTDTEAQQLDETQVPDTHAEDLLAESTNPPEEGQEAVKIKDEPKNEPSSAPTPPVVASDAQSTTPAGPSDNASDVKPSTSPPVRRGRHVCRYGVKCYRKNASHRDEEAHPGDPDYSLPDYPKPPSGTPQCPYGASCYRRNPLHFQQLSHSGSPPPKRAPADNPPPAKRRRRQYPSDSEDSDDGADEMADFLQDDSDEDPYHCDGTDSDDYDPDEDSEFEDGH